MEAYRKIQKYGFVYIWRDKKKNRYYIGSHWGTPDDGYVCSSSWMKKTYKIRPTDFCRKILYKTMDRPTLLVEEEKWLHLIKDEELGKKYYNLNNKGVGHWSTNENSRKGIKQKLSERHKGRIYKRGWHLTEEQKLHLSKINKGKPLNYTRSEETRKKISENSKRLITERRIWMCSKKHSEDTISKMKNNNSMKNPIHVQKVTDSKKGIKWLTNGVDKKMAVPETEKFSILISNGYNVIIRKSKKSTRCSIK